MQRQTEVAVLQLMRIAGYLNFAWLAVALLSMKTGWQPWSVICLPIAVTVVGALLYRTAWESAFVHTPRSEGRRFARPYILGTSLLVGTIILLLLLGLLGRSKA